MILSCNLTVKQCVMSVLQKLSTVSLLLMQTGGGKYSYNICCPTAVTKN